MRFVRVLGLLAMAFAASALLLESPQLKAQTIGVGSTNSRMPKLIRTSPTRDTKPAPSRKQSGNVHVYLLRGWLDVFSTGMDDLTVKLNRRGIRATVHGHMDYYILAESIAKRYRDGEKENVVIIGHSLGANAAVQMAQRLGDHKIPVPLVITYDPTVVVYATPNVAHVVNFYQSNNGWGTRVASVQGFNGKLDNLDLAREAELGHTGIDKSNKLHMQTIAYIQSLGGGGSAARSRSSSARQGETAKPAAPAASSPKRPPPISSQAPASSTERRPAL